MQKVLAASLRGGDGVRDFCRRQRQALLAESKTLQTLRRERDHDAGAAFTIEVAILRTGPAAAKTPEVPARRTARRGRG